MNIFKIVILFYLSFIFIGNLIAQIPNGSIAPDFEVVDINGNTHHLQAYLDEGKTVILEIGATWCHPCWSHVQSGTLNAAHQILGAEGLDKAVVLFIEGEPLNSIDQINGIEGSSGNNYADLTFGNWTNVIDYPIINNANIADLYQISYYPTVFKICPNDRTTTEIGLATLAPILDTVLNSDCIMPELEHDIALLRYTGTASVCNNTLVELPVEIINMGSQPISDALIMVQDASNPINSQPLSSTLETYQRQTIKLGPVELIQEQALTFEVTTPLDKNPHNNYQNQIIQLATIGQSLTVTLDLTTDEYGFETYWEIRGLDGTVHYSGGNTEVGIENGGWPYVNSPYAVGAYDNLIQISETMTLPYADCYELVFVDDYGDGICCEYGQGGYTLADELGNILVQGGQFNDYQIQAFSVETEPTAGTEILTPSISYYPNPATDILYIDYPFAEKDAICVQFFNTLGQAISTHFISPLHSFIDISAMDSGIYYLRIVDKQAHIYASKLIID